MKKHYFNKILPGNRTTLQVLKRAVIRGGALVATDLEQWTFIENEDTRDVSRDGEVYDLTVLKKTPDLKVAKCNDFNRADFPIFGDFKNAIPMPLEIPRRLPDFASYCSWDSSTRICLTGVYIKLGGGIICATGGHALREGKIVSATGSDKEFIVSARTAAFIKAMKQEILLSAEVNDEYIKLVYAGGGGVIITYYDRLVEGPYPNYNTCLPDRARGHTVDCTVANRQGVRAAIKRLREYGAANKKNEVVIFNKNVITYDAAHGYKTVADVPALFEKSLRAFSAPLLLRVLSDLPDGTVSVQSFKDGLRGVMFYAGVERFALYPLRPPKDEDWPSRGEIVT